MSDAPSGDDGRAPGDEAPANRFERHARITLIVAALAVFGLLELVSYFVVRLPGFYREYNRVVSGYMVFKNNPKYPMKTSKSRPDLPDVVLDEYGFVSAGPVSTEKEPGSVRIFFMGGSAAFGSEQNADYREIHAYPPGLYSFPDSIAGQLQAVLGQRRPGTRFEVITAAAYTRAYHQSVLHYLETISRFSPDWVVTMDGFNDVNHLVSGRPYRDREAELPYYLDLRNTSDCLERVNFNTYCMLEGLHNRLMLKITRGRRRQAPAFARPFDLDRYTRDQYLERKPDLVEGSRRFVQTLRHEIGILKADGVEFLFVLQPMLHRQGWNKELSPLEERLARGRAPPVYASLPSTQATEPRAYVDALLVLEYFFDDHLSSVLEAEARRGGAHYLDMNRALKDVPASVEFYTDYCHMTPEGNRLIAEAIADVVLASPRASAY